MLPNPEENLDPRVKRTRSSVMLAFSDLLAEKSFESISVKDVTDRAEINRATFYAHFQDKFALLDFAIQQMFFAEIESRMLNACSYSPDNLRNLMVAVCEFLGKLHSSCNQPHQQFESLVEGTIKRQIFDLLTHWLRNANIPTEIPSRSILRFFTNYCGGTLPQNFPETQCHFETSALCWSWKSQGWCQIQLIYLHLMP